MRGRFDRYEVLDFVALLLTRRAWKQGELISVGKVPGGWVYEQFVTTLLPEGFLATDVLDLYQGRGAFEGTLADEDREGDPDRWCSLSAPGPRLHAEPCGASSSRRAGVWIARMGPSARRAPELMPCEDLWRQLKAAVAANRTYRISPSWPSGLWPGWTPFPRWIACAEPGSLLPSSSGYRAAVMRLSAYA